MTESQSKYLNDKALIKVEGGQVELEQADYYSDCESIFTIIQMCFISIFKMQLILSLIVNV